MPRDRLPEKVLMAGNVVLSINVIPERTDTAINVNSATMRRANCV